MFVCGASRTNKTNKKFVSGEAGARAICKTEIFARSRAHDGICSQIQTEYEFYFILQHNPLHMCVYGFFFFRYPDIPGKTEMIVTSCFFFFLNFGCVCVCELMHADTARAKYKLEMSFLFLEHQTQRKKKYYVFRIIYLSFFLNIICEIETLFFFGKSSFRSYLICMCKIKARLFHILNIILFWIKLYIPYVKCA